MADKTDYEGDRAHAKKLLEQGDAEAIALALRAAYHKGYEQGKKYHEERRRNFLDGR